MFQNPSRDVLRDILEQSKTIAVVGLSDNPDRESYAVSEQMLRRGYRIIPVNPQVTEVLNEQAYPRLSDIPFPIDIVNIFRRSEALPGVVGEAAQTSAPVIWAQKGIFHEDAIDIAKRHQKTLVMDCCILVMHSALVKRTRS